MSLMNYVTNCRYIREELEESLRKKDIRLLADSLYRGTHEACWDWQQAHRTEVEKLVACTPAQRLKNASWQHDRLHYAMLCLAGIDVCEQAAALLSFLEQHEYQLRPGGSYRAMANTAGNLFEDLCHVQIPPWPEAFAAVCPSPFHE